ncbi:MAG: prolipoprotein diacylglyceryl transferase [Ardenticatenaceae bacterium]|nr:prolipoprotein diacylglyceryl transferase [Ardenticatenaceae bacterium]
MLDFLKTDPIAFTIPIGENGFPIFWYGILVTIGIAIGAWWAVREIARRNQDVDEFYNGLILVVFVGYLFARLTYVLLDVIDGNSGQYSGIIDVLNIRSGGVNILGGFVGAFLAAIIFMRWRRLNFWHYADVAGPALLIAQAVGRWGNFINQELYGPPTQLPWGITIDPRFRLPQFADLSVYPVETRFHPTFLYESLWLLLGFIILLVLNARYRDQWRPGTLFGLFLIWWGGGRTWIEFFRPDQPTIGGSVITYSMITALLIALAGVVVLMQRYGKLPETGAAVRRRRRRTLKPKPRRTEQ